MRRGAIVAGVVAALALLAYLRWTPLPERPARGPRRSEIAGPPAEPADARAVESAPRADGGGREGGDLAEAEAPEIQEEMVARLDEHLEHARAWWRKACASSPATLQAECRTVVAELERDEASPEPAVRAALRWLDRRRQGGPSRSEARVLDFLDASVSAVLQDGDPAAIPTPDEVVDAPGRAPTHPEVYRREGRSVPGQGL